ncbi:hypothetical protein H257_02051 [Aphanomyces astaci]|uniref:Uncharacterized protein n=1 Tax=Aphanomyces astaci TaxID=112090 RepID=W4H645_APHAT|nr:hypothetical protein H257_02051 [Aphanomyces astaci]ETV87041.1 hypothetical protein H257_02051 [Aphanomyces astaci]|eukprot:XP_009823840.1 hypothetical protein H257_02051 [Aphanomyces astaci]
MERPKVLAKENTKKKSTTTASTKLKAPPGITATRRKQPPIAKTKLTVKAAKIKEARQKQRAKKSQKWSAEEEPHVEDFLMEFVPTQPPIIPEGRAMSREEMKLLLATCTAARSNFNTDETYFRRSVRGTLPRYSE